MQYPTINIYRQSEGYGALLNNRTVTFTVFLNITIYEKGAHDLFIDLLGKYCIPKYIVSIIELQLIKLFNHYHNVESSDNHLLESQIKALEEKKKTLQIRYGLGEVNGVIYDTTLRYLAGQMQVVQKEIKAALPKISSLKKLLDNSLQELNRLNVLWASCNLDNKRKIQKLLFPEGIFYDARNHEYVIRKVNDLVIGH